MRYIRAVSFLLLFLRATGARSEVLNLEVYDNGGCFNWIRVKYVQCAKFNVVNAKFLSRSESFELDIKHAKNATTPFEDVRKVEFTGGQVDYYPGHLFEFYEELTQVVIKGTNTSSIEKGFFTFISELKVFESEDNPLKTLGPYIFEDGTSFGVIHLENNQLVEIHSDAFRTLTQTKSISLSRNQLTHVDPLWFQDLGQLIVFEMKQNLLHNIDGRVFGRLKLLKKLHLNNNFIEKLEKYTFKENSRLRLLDLSDNIILEIPTKLFSNILRLRDLKLTGNDCINATFHYQPISVIEEALDVSCKPNDLTSNKDDGSCQIPKIPNGRVLNVFDKEPEKPGTFFTDDLPVIVECDKKYSLLFIGEDEKKIFCADGAWDKSFPECKKLCPKQGITGPTTKPTCEYDGASISCDSNLLPDTVATITCKAGYKKPSNLKVDKDLTCLESGEWNYNLFKCEPVCGKATPHATAYIYKGFTAAITEIPWHVGIYKHDQQICGGTIISERIVLSAAHCFEMESATKNREDFASIFKVAAGKIFKDLDANESLKTQILDVQEILIDENFNGYYNFYLADIAVLILKQFFEYQPHIAPVCIDFSPEKNMMNGTMSLVAGWGLTEHGNQSAILKKIKMPIVDLETCKDRAPSDYKDFIISDKLCAGYSDGSGVCSGDSGGGLSVATKIKGEDVYYIEGIVSNGKRDTSVIFGCDLNFFSVFTNVQQYSGIIKYAVRNFPFM